MDELVVRDLGRMRYEPAFEEQCRVHAAAVAGGADTLLLVEHEPVATTSKRPDARQHLLAGKAMLAQHGVEVCATNRGGDITYHGPGQIVAYPIINLSPRTGKFPQGAFPAVRGGSEIPGVSEVSEGRGLNLRQYVWLLEQTIIDTVAQFGIAAHRDAGAVGVWVGEKVGGAKTDPNAANHTSQAAKIAAIGVRISRWVTMHGLALNVTTNLDHFKLIVPCGLAGRPVTSMKRQLGERCPTMDAVKQVLVAQLRRNLRSDRPHSPGQLPAR